MIADGEWKEKMGRECWKAGYLYSMSSVQFLVAVSAAQREFRVSTLIWAFLTAVVGLL